MEMKKTERGFSVIEFPDRYGVGCSLQESSADEPCIWLGPNDANPQMLIPGKGWTPVAFPEDTLFDTRMHLTQEQVKELLPHLKKFVETGSI